MENKSRHAKQGDKIYPAIRKSLLMRHFIYLCAHRNIHWGILAADSTLALVMSGNLGMSICDLRETTVH
jgi:hypothetical protein